MPYVRIRSILRKLDGVFATPETLMLEAPEERLLAAKLLQLGEIVPLVLEDFRPNLLANYLYDLAIIFHAFYEACPVLKAEGAERRDSRLGTMRRHWPCSRDRTGPVGDQVP